MTALVLQVLPIFLAVAFMFLSRITCQSMAGDPVGRYMIWAGRRTDCRLPDHEAHRKHKDLRTE